MSQRLLLLGADGQVGWELRRALLPLGEVIACTRTGVDLADSAGLEALLERVRPDVIVNAAAYTAVDQAEREPDPARRINADAPGLLARYAASENAWLVHYSTDYVFDGTGTVPWTEADAPRPQNVYGQSKLLGEAAIVRSGCRHLVFRTSWVYAARGQNFAKTMLRLALTRDSLRVVADQTGVPTSAELLADVTALALYRVLGNPGAHDRSGVYHLVPAGETTWHGYARHVLARAGSLGWRLRCTPEAVEPIATADYPLPARRPANSRLDTTKLRTAFGLGLPDWTVQVDRMVAELPLPEDGGDSRA